MKIAVVAPNYPMDIALNRESQRKTPTNVGIKVEERYFSDAATAMHLKYPSETYGYLVDLLGKKFDHPIVHLFRERFPYYVMEPDPDRGTVLFRNNAENVYSVEELIGMQIAEARKIASLAAKQPVKDVVIAVPAYFNQAERRSMIEAATIGGANVLQLINDNTAAAVNFGMLRRKEFNETGMKILIFDQGAWKTTATVCEFKIVKDISLSKNPQLTVLGFGFDRTLGGLEASLRLGNRWARNFHESYVNKKSSKKGNGKYSRIFDDPKAMRKILKEADRVKRDLSTTTDRSALIEEVFDNVDLKAPVTRQQFEDMISDFPGRIKKVVDDALQMADMDLSQLDYIVLMGGSTRVPKIQESLQAAVKGRELNRYLNTDEAIVMGAVYMAAHRCRGFKVKKFLVKDLNAYPVAVDFEKEPSQDDKENNDSRLPLSDESVPKIRRILFKHKNHVPSKKKMTFSKHTHDFEFAINYDNLTHLSPNQLNSFGSLNISKVTVIGLSDYIEKRLKNDGVSYKGARVHFRMDESGLLHVESADLAFESLAPVETKNQSTASAFKKFGEKLSNFFTGSSSDDASADLKNATDDKQTVLQNQTAESELPNEAVKNNDTNDTLKNTTGEDYGPPSSSPPKVIQENIPVKTEISFSDIKAISKERMSEIKSRIKKFETLEEIKWNRAEARHLLESFIIDFKMKLLDEDESLFIHSTEDERQKIREKLNEFSDWLDEQGDSTDKEEYASKLVALKTLTADIIDRMKEAKDRPKAIESLEKILNYSGMFLTGMQNLSTLAAASLSNETTPSIFTEVELNTLGKAINETQTWYDNTKSAQSKLKPTEKPVMTVKLLNEKLLILEREVNYLITKAKYYKPPKKPVRNETMEKENRTDEIKVDEKEEKLSEAADEEENAEKTDEPKDNEADINQSKDEKHTEL